MVMPKILLVNSSEFFLEMAKGFLKQSAVSILTARSGMEALDLARRHRPNLVYLDFGSDDMEGESCCRTFKSDPVLAKTPVILIIAAAGEQNRHIYLQTGCDALMTKPVARNDFLAVGRSFLERIERRELRVPCRATVLFRIESTVAYGTIEDLSPHGMYIGFAGEMTLGTETKLSFVLPGRSAELMEMDASVAWVNCGSKRKKQELPPGFGVEFQHMSDGHVESLRLFLEYSMLRHPQVEDEEPAKDRGSIAKSTYPHS